MSRRKPTPDELLDRMLTPFDEEIDPVLAMTAEEVRASLAEDGFDVAAIESDARAFLGLPPKRRRRSRLPFIVMCLAPFTLGGSVIETCGPLAPAAMPFFAKASDESITSPTPTGAAPPSPTQTTSGGPQ